VRRAVLGSSGSVYGASGRLAESLDELATPQQPEGLYGLSKQAAEGAAQRLAALHGLDLVVGRLGTCFGPWEAATGARDTLSAPYQVLQLARRGEAAVLPRDSRRDWLYVRDAAAALAALLDRPALPSPVYNLAAGFQWPMSQWCARVAEWQPGFAWHIAGVAAAAHGPPNVSYYAPYDRAPMAIERLRADTGFVPRFDLDAAAADFSAWLAPRISPSPPGGGPGWGHDGAHIPAISCSTDA
jgi:UDP-glucuronate 4-epimerase